MSIRQLTPCTEAGQHDGDTWPVHDARGIYIGRVCKRCERAILSTYRPEVLSDPNYEADEDIEPDL